MTPYTELQVTTNFSFLRGASHPEELFVRAHELGYGTLGVVDRGSLAGMVRAHVAAKATGVRLLVGCRLDPEDHLPLLVYPTDRAAYGRLCCMLTAGKARGGKGACRLAWADIAERHKGLIAVTLPDAADATLGPRLADLRALFGDRCYLALTRRFRPDDDARLAALDAAARAARVPTVATNDVLYHAPERRILQDVLTCVREGTTIDRLGFRRERFADRFLKPPAEMARLFRRHPDAVARTAEIVERCRFSLDELKYQYPEEEPIRGLTAQQALEKLAREGAEWRYPAGVPERVTANLDHELALIAELRYAPYFLTVMTIVRAARERDILCQGRGSAANSTVCFCLGITEIGPDKHDLLFERFISAERQEPPDIDVDFEHERREEVIQWIYQTYGHERAALAATVIRYRTRGAVRDVGKALGLPVDVTAALSSLVWGWSNQGLDATAVRGLNLDPDDWRLKLTLELSRELVNFPRHLSQHPGGFVLTRDRLDTLVPIEPATMAERQVVEWDKDDLEALNMLKVDVLGLGMLGAVRRCLDLLRAHKGIDRDMAGILSHEEPEVYAMLSRGDSVGVFQVESRAQMAMLPRLKPKTFYDLVIEVAIVRPGPIQGDMVHPYLRRREGKDPEDYPTPELKAVLKKTLGVPLFQEQAMKMAMVCAGFTAAEADRLRRSMATFKAHGKVSEFRDKLVGGMVANGYQRDFAERCFRQIEGFGSYGFPESHAASFSLLVYVSAWLKCRHPDVFLCGLLNAQPMGFYAPAQLVRDARDHGVEVRPADIGHSDWDCTLEAAADGRHAVRLGLRLVKGLSEADAAKIVAARATRPFADLHDLWRRAGVRRASLERLAEADAYGSLGLDRRAALWAIRGFGDDVLPLFAAADAREQGAEPAVALPAMPLGAQMMEDYASLKLSLRAHPLALLRPVFAARGVARAEALRDLDHGARVKVAGLVITRQRPGEGHVIFLTLEDETGIANIIVWPRVFERFRRVVMGARLIVIEGRLQKAGEGEHLVLHVVSERLHDASRWLDTLAENRPTTDQRRRLFASRDFH